MSPSTHKCKSCRLKFTEGFLKLPFGGIMCKDCVDGQCELDLEDSNIDDISIDALKVCQEPAPSKLDPECMGIKLFKIKNEIDQFKGDIDHYAKKIEMKVKPVRLAININFNYWKQEIERQQAMELSELDEYKRQMMTKINTYNIETQRQKSKEQEQCLLMLKQPNQCLPSSYIDTFTRDLNQQQKEVNKLILSNQKFVYEKPFNKNTSLNEIGHLEFTNCDENNNYDTTTKDKLDTSPYFKPKDGPQVDLTIISFHILTENIVLVCQEKLTRRLRLKLFNINSIKFVHEIQLPNSEPLFLTCSDMNYFLTVDSSVSTYEIILYDEQLTQLQTRTIPSSSYKLIDAFLNNHLFVLSIKTDLKLKIYGPDLNENKQITLMDIERFNNSTDYKIIVIDLHLFLSQKFLFGTRINMINYSTGEFIWKIDLYFFFDKYFVDLKMDRIVYFCDNYFYVYNMQSKKNVAKMTCHNLDKSLCLFDTQRHGEAFILSTY